MPLVIPFVGSHRLTGTTIIIIFLHVFSYIYCVCTENEDSDASSISILPWMKRIDLPKLNRITRSNPFTILRDDDGSWRIYRDSYISSQIPISIIRLHSTQSFLSHTNLNPIQFKKKNPFFSKKKKKNFHNSLSTPIKHEDLRHCSNCPSSDHCLRRPSSCRSSRIWNWNWN